MADLSGRSTTRTSGSRDRRRGWLRAGGASSLLVAAATVGWVLLGADNLREVVPGQVLRSAQPSPADLAQLVHRRGLRTVVNLRTSGLRHDWLRTETAACSSLGIGLYSIGFSVTEWPRQSSVRELVEVVDAAPRPLLLHCRRGTDRAGWAAVVVRLLDGDPPEEALSELDLWHGHLCDRKTCPLHQFFASYESYLERSGQTHSGATFRRWATEVYCPEPYHAELELEEPLPAAVTSGTPLRLAVRVRNRGDQGWTMAAAKGGTRLGVRAFGPFAAPPPDVVGATRGVDHPALDLARADAAPGELPPGGDLRLAVSFRAPLRPGLYILQVDMVREQVHWFSDMGGPGILARLRVRRPQEPGGSTAAGPRR